MNQQIFDKLREWRNLKAEQGSLKVFMILHNQTIEDIATVEPKTKEDLIDVKGISEKKFDRYGEEILQIVRNNQSEPVRQNGIKNNMENNLEKKIIKTSEKDSEKYTVSTYLNYINQSLIGKKASVKGEISEVSKRQRYLFFKIKDSQDESAMDCFMWENNYRMSGVELEEGMEVMVHGHPEIYKPMGKFSFQASAVELVGEGALKKAYEKLKEKLFQEGLFSEERKKILPVFPKKIGLITSRDGAAINDFLNNLGKHGFKTVFYDSRVEGQLAVEDLIKAVKFFKKEKVDSLVMIRGGGSLESLQAFNNEALIREVADLDFPLICGIGHDKDVPLISLLADKAVSTPTAVAEILNKSWQEASYKIDIYEKNVLTSFSEILQQKEYQIDQIAARIKESFQNVIRKFDKFHQLLGSWLSSLTRAINNNQRKLKEDSELITAGLQRHLSKTSREIDNYQRNFEANNPERQLKLGYSIATVNGKVLKSVRQVEIGQDVKLKLTDGKIISEVKKKV
jgi:exodeoxyribonuclease VII large subunit